MQKSPDASVRRAYEILQRLIEEGGGEEEPVQSHWRLPALPPPDPNGKFSATDLLSWWFRAPLDQPDPWDAYLGPPSQGTTAPPAPAIPGPEPSRAPWWASELASFEESEEGRLAEEHAEAAVECLYEFLHAVGRRDVEAAMALTAEDYHTMEDDQEVDRLRLRQRLETLLDSLRGWDIEVSLAEAPEPLSHPYGVLITAFIQLDASREDGSRRSVLERRVAVLQPDGEGEWKISALSLVPA